MEAQVGKLLALEPREAGEKLLSGQIDMAFMMTSWDSPVVAALSLKETEVAARQLGIELKSIEVRNPNDFDSAFTSAMNFHANAIVILSAPVMTIYAGRLAELARENGLPAISNVSVFPWSSQPNSSLSSILQRPRRSASLSPKLCSPPPTR